ncbi:TolC family protein [Neolewinella aurantiaca]|uniref:TolC family protein n=1 Tax=Neolewinella aurantiaca TaxID=2602767 RepID=A0A5C7FM42_9BACT|nr:TolC family protein [Neolewinella aurantiaca]TXF88472.1 TolC family protein [Neolewinella aurantiaca]
MRQVYFLLVSFLFTGSLFAQSGDTWTLERAVEYALTNNLQVRQLDNITEIARLNQQQAKNNRLPTASGSTNVGVQLGRTIDPTTNEFNQQTIGFQGYQVQFGISLYNGGLIKNTLRQSEVDLAAARLDQKVTANNIGLQVANGYLNIVLLKEQLNNTRAQLQLTNDQLSNTDVLIKAGALPAAQRFDLVAQRASNQRAIVDLENQVELAELSLKILLELDLDADFEIVTPELNPSETELFATYDVNEVYSSARGIQPTVAAAELRRESSEMGIEIAKAGMRPSISLFGSVSTNFSTAAKDFTNPIDVIPPTFDFGPMVPVRINGEDATISELVATGGSADFKTLNYFDQLDRNFGQSAGMTLSVPIYSQGRNKINVQRAEVQRANAELDIEQADNQLRNDIQLALSNLRGAQETYRAAQASEEASKMAYDNAQRSYKAGAANSLELVTASNRFEQAQTELTRSKYQLIFNRQVIRFYLGQGFSLN